MVLPERLAVGYSEECDAHLSTVLVHCIFHIHTHCTRALIQDGELWLVVEQPSHLL